MPANPRFPLLRLFFICLGLLSAAACTKKSSSNSNPGADLVLTKLVITQVTTQVASLRSRNVTWVTDGPGTSEADYGSASVAEHSLSGDGTAVTAHSLALPNLTPGLTYQIQVRSRNANNDITQSDVVTFKQPLPPIPVVSNILSTPAINTSVITWTTDSPADSKVSYGPTTNYGTNSTLDTNLVTTHRVVISGLNPATVYHFAVVSNDEFQQVVTGSDRMFTTLTPPGPVNSLVTANPQMTSATVSWTTDATSTSQVEYGLTANYGSATMLDSNLVTKHSQVLTALTAGTTYHYHVKSVDAFKQLSASLDATFTTLPPPAPKISNVKVNVLGLSAVISWTTDVASDTQVKYGTTTNYGQTTLLSATPVTSHSQTISNLTAGATYHFQAVSTDAYKQTSVSGDVSFGPHRLARLLLNGGNYPFGGNVTPLVGDVDGDGREDAVFYFASTGTWLAFQANNVNPGKAITLKGGASFSAASTHSYGLLGYLDDDLIADRAVYYPETGIWIASNSKTASTVTLGSLPKLGGIPFLADLTGEGFSSQVIYYPNDGTWDYLLNPNCKPDSGHNLFAGNPVVPGWQAGDIPLMGSLNANGVADRIVVRSATLSWFAALTGSSNVYSFGDSNVDSKFGTNPNWGRANWAIPFTGDIYGFGISDRIIFNPPDPASNLASGWGVSYSNPSFTREAVAAGFGTAQGIPLVGDFFGTGHAAFAFYDPSQNIWKALDPKGTVSSSFNPGFTPKNGTAVREICLGKYADSSGVELSAFALQACINNTTSTASLLLPIGNYRIDSQVIINRPMTVSTSGLKAGATCFTPPLGPNDSITDPSKGAVSIDGVTNANGLACARLYADDNFFQIAPKASLHNDLWGMVYVNGNDLNAVGKRLQNVVVDHLILDGNGLNREAAWAALGKDITQGPCVVNSSGCGNLMFIYCDNCVVQNSVSMRVPAPRGTTYALSFDNCDGPQAIKNLFWANGHIDYDSSGNFTNGHGANAFQIWAIDRPAHNVLVDGNFSIDNTDGGITLQSENQEVFGEVKNNYIYQRTAVQPSSGILLNVGPFSPNGYHSHGLFGNGAAPDPTKTLWVHNNFIHGDQNASGTRKITFGIALGSGGHNGFSTAPVPITQGQAAVLASNPVVINFLRIEGARIEQNQVFDARVGINDDAAGTLDKPTYVLDNVVGGRTNSAPLLLINKADKCTNDYNPQNDGNGNPYSYLADLKTLKPTTINPDTDYDANGYLFRDVNCVVDQNYSTSVMANPTVQTVTIGNQTALMQTGDYSQGKGFFRSNISPGGWSHYDTSRWQKGAAFGRSPGFPQFQD